MSGVPQLPSLGSEFAEIRRRLDVLERSPRGGARDEPLPLTPYEGWPGGVDFRAVAQLGTGGLTLPVLRLDFRASTAGTGYVEFRLCDVDTGRVTTNAVAIGIAPAQWLRVEWLHPLGPPQTRTGTWRRVLLQARQSVGTPALSIGLGLAAGVPTLSAPGATAGGTWSAVNAPAGY